MWHSARSPGTALRAGCTPFSTQARKDLCCGIPFEESLQAMNLGSLTQWFSKYPSVCQKCSTFVARCRESQGVGLLDPATCGARSVEFQQFKDFSPIQIQILL